MGLDLSRLSARPPQGSRAGLCVLSHRPVHLEVRCTSCADQMCRLFEEEKASDENAKACRSSLSGCSSAEVFGVFTTETPDIRIACRFQL